MDRNDMLEQGWEEMRILLDKELPEKSKRRFIPFWWGIGTLALVAVLTMIFLFPNNQDKIHYADIEISKGISNKSNQKKELQENNSVLNDTYDQQLTNNIQTVNNDRKPTQSTNIQLLRNDDKFQEELSPSQHTQRQNNIINSDIKIEYSSSSPVEVEKTNDKVNRGLSDVILEENTFPSIRLQAVPSMSINELISAKKIDNNLPKVKPYHTEKPQMKNFHFSHDIFLEIGKGYSNSNYGGHFFSNLSLYDSGVSFIGGIGLRKWAFSYQDSLLFPAQAAEIGGNEIRVNGLILADEAGWSIPLHMGIRYQIFSPLAIYGMVNYSYHYYDDIIDESIISVERSNQTNTWGINVGAELIITNSILVGLGYEAQITSQQVTARQITNTLGDDIDATVDRTNNYLTIRLGYRF